MSLYQISMEPWIILSKALNNLLIASPLIYNLVAHSSKLLSSSKWRALHFTTKVHRSYHAQFKARTSLSAGARCKEFLVLVMVRHQMNQCCILNGLMHKFNFKLIHVDMIYRLLALISTSSGNLEWSLYII